MSDLDLTADERYSFCPHGVLVAGPISANVYMFVAPWPCPEPGCTLARFEQSHAEAAS